MSPLALALAIAAGVVLIELSIVWGLRLYRRRRELVR